jgi:hypothetical protein
MSGLQLRDARASDRGAIEAVTLSAFQEYAASMPNRWEAYRQNILAALGAVQPAAQIVAEQESEIIGSGFALSQGDRDRHSGKRADHIDLVRGASLSRCASGAGSGRRRCSHARVHAASAPLRGEGSRPPYLRHREGGDAAIRADGLSARSRT